MNKVRSLYENSNTRALLRGAAAPLPEPLARWLGQLAILEGVPFNALVPDARMLPEESIRFFYLDQNWLDALLDGALSVAAAFDAHHAATVELLRAHIQRNIQLAAAHERNKKRLARRAQNTGRFPVKERSYDVDPDPPLWTGFLLRSAAVADWPGLNVRAFRDEAGLDPIELLRAERLSPTVLFALFRDTAKRFDVAVPPQGLRFGAERDKELQLRVAARGLGGAFASGEQIENVYAPVAERENTGGRRVLDVKKTHASIEAALKNVYGEHAMPPLDPGAFAMEMVAGSQNQRFFNTEPK